MGLVAICLFAVLAAGMGPPVGAAATSDANATHHVPPEAAGEAGDRTAVSTRLLDSMAGDLENSSEAMSNGDFERASDLLGDDFERDLERYRSLADAGEATDREELAASLNRTRADQRRLAETGSELRTATERYREARESGNQTAARESLDRVERLGGTLETDSERVDSSYAGLEEHGVETGGAAEAVSGVPGSLGERALQETTSEFRTTRLSVISADDRAGPTDPLAVRVRLRGPDGPIPPDSGTFTLGGEPMTITDWNESTVELRARPLWLDPGERERHLTFHPDPESAYAASRTTVTVEVRSATPTIELATPDSAGYGDRLAVTATVTVDDRPVPNASVRANVADTSFATAETAANGTARLSGPVPDAVGPGERDLRVDVERTAAVAATSATTDVQIERTPTRLAANATDGRLAGRLRTADGRELSGQVLQVRGEGLDRTVVTDARGTFAVALDGASGPITVSYEPRGVALAASETTVAGSGPALPASSSGWLAVVGLLALVGVGAGAVWVRSRGTARAPEAAGRPPVAAESEARSIGWLYRAAREAVPGSHPALTPRETARRAREELSERQAAVVAAIVRAYERETYALDPIDEPAVRAHRRAIRWLFDR